MWHICFPKERDTTGLHDLRTREGRRSEVLAQVRTFGGFTIFWATDVQKRAKAIEALETDGSIYRSEVPSVFPWTHYEVRDDGD